VPRRGRGRAEPPLSPRHGLKDRKLNVGSRGICPSSRPDPAGGTRPRPGKLAHGKRLASSKPSSRCMRRLGRGAPADGIAGGRSSAARIYRRAEIPAEGVEGAGLRGRDTGGGPGGRQHPAVKPAVVRRRPACDASAGPRGRFLGHRGSAGCAAIVKRPVARYSIRAPVLLPCDCPMKGPGAAACGPATDDSRLSGHECGPLRPADDDGRGWFRTSDLSRVKRGRGEYWRQVAASSGQFRLRVSRIRCSPLTAWRRR
jgi:hypothetical protein